MSWSGEAHTQHTHMPGRKYWLYTLGSLNLRPHGLDMSIIHLACLHNLKSWPFLIWHWLLNHFAWRSGGFPRQTPPFFKTSIFSKKFRDRLLYDLYHFGDVQKKEGKKPSRSQRLGWTQFQCVTLDVPPNRMRQKQFLPLGCYQFCWPPMSNFLS